MSEKQPKAASWAELQPRGSGRIKTNVGGDAARKLRAAPVRDRLSKCVGRETMENPLPTDNGDKNE